MWIMLTYINDLFFGVVAYYEILIREKPAYNWGRDKPSLAVSLLPCLTEHEDDSKCIFI